MSLNPRSGTGGRRRVPQHNVGARGGPPAAVETGRVMAGLSTAAPIPSQSPVLGGQVPPDQKQAGGR